MIFRLLYVTFLEIFICLLINFKAGTDASSDFEAISRIVSIFMLVICALFILLMFTITTIESDPERDQKEPHVVSLETLYLGMSIKRKSASNVYIIASTFRRAIYALVAIMMHDYPAL